MSTCYHKDCEDASVSDSAFCERHRGPYVTPRAERIERVKLLKSHLAELGCGDASCLVNPQPSGQCTNGGCRCLPRVGAGELRLKLQHVLTIYRALVKELEGR